MVKFFDREHLRDCCSELYKLDIKGTIYRLTFLLNKETNISIRTAVGSTDSYNVGETLGQGTSESGLVSSSNLAGGVSEYFSDSKVEANYSGLDLSACIFQDDLARLSEDLDSVREGNRRLEEMAESKLLDFHDEKSGMIIFGSKKFKKKIEQNLLVDPVIFCGKPMQIFNCERYLGDFLGNSVSESVFLTIQKRQTMVQRLIREIRLTVNDCRSNCVGGLSVGLEIWQKAASVYLYNNSECWMETPRKAMNLLKSLTHSFFRSFFNSSKGNHIVMYYWDTMSLQVEFVLILRKLLFLRHLICLPDNLLAKEILSLQRQDDSFPCFVSECNAYLERLGITTDPASHSKKQWNELISTKVHELNKESLLEQIRGSRKLDIERITSEEYKPKSYLKEMTVEDGRTFFSYRSSMLKAVQCNFKNNRKYKENQYLCKCKEHLDSQSSLLECRLYDHLKEGLNIYSSDADLVKFFQLVIQQRIDEEKEENSNRVVF